MKTYNEFMEQFSGREMGRTNHLARETMARRKENERASQERRAEAEQKRQKLEGEIQQRKAEAERKRENSLDQDPVHPIDDFKNLERRSQSV